MPKNFSLKLFWVCANSCYSEIDKIHAKYKERLQFIPSSKGLQKRLFFTTCTGTEPLDINSQ